MLILNVAGKTHIFLSFVYISLCSFSEGRGYCSAKYRMQTKRRMQANVSVCFGCALWWWGFPRGWRKMPVWALLWEFCSGHWLAVVTTAGWVFCLCFLLLVWGAAHCCFGSEADRLGWHPRNCTLLLLPDVGADIPGPSVVRGKTLVRHTGKWGRCELSALQRG